MYTQPQLSGGGCLIWENEPVGSGELVRLAADNLGWKKSTTYTVIRRLTEMGVLVSDNAVIRSLYSKEDIQRQESREFIDRTFGCFPLCALLCPSPSKAC